MELKMCFGLVLGRLAILKKNWANYEQLFRVVISCFHGHKKCLMFFKKIVCNERLHNISFIYFFLAQNRLNIHNQSVYWRHLPARLLYNDFGNKSLDMKYKPLPNYNNNCKITECISSIQSHFEYDMQSDLP
jgi:hypothetical protein